MIISNTVDYISRRIQIDIVDLANLRRTSKFSVPQSTSYTEAEKNQDRHQPVP